MFADSELLNEDYAKRVYVSAWKRDTVKKYIISNLAVICHTVLLNLYNSDAGYKILSSTLE